jgi:hypothetical protein
MDPIKRRLHPFLIKFEPELELEFCQEQAKYSAAILRSTILVVTIILVLTGIGFWADWLGKLPSAAEIAPIFFLPPVLVLAFAITYSKNLAIIGDFIVSLIVLILFTCVVWTMRSYPDSRRSFAHGMVFVFLTVNAGLPYRWTHKAVTGLICILTFAAIAWHDQVYQLENFLQIHTQLLMTLFFSVAIGFLLERFIRSQYLLKLELAAEKERSETLLLNILPKAIAERMKKQSGAIVDSFADVTVMFADIVGFTALAESMVNKPNKVSFPAYQTTLARKNCSKSGRAC